VTGPDRRLPILAIAAFLAVLAVSLFEFDRRSLERANRLYRAGQTTAASERYRAIDPGPSGRAAYNLGTSLLALGSPEADEHLRDGVAGNDSTARQKSYYNLAYLQLVQVDPSLEVDSAIVLLRNSIGNGRAAVRLDPLDEDALWNLTLAQQMLDSLTNLPENPRSQDQAGQDETVIDLVSITRSEEGSGRSGPEPQNPPVGESSGERQAAAQGARESWATFDPGPLTSVNASALIAAVDDDPEKLIHGILWSRRPDIAWWSGEEYPGGDW